MYLYPAEIIDVLQKGYEDGLIYPEIIGFESFEDALKKGEAWCLERMRDDYENNSLDDLHKAMSWWACFHPDDEDDFLSDSPGRTEKPKKQKAKDKKKRKQAKASRRKNRRR